MVKKLFFLLLILFAPKIDAQKKYPSNTWAQISIDCKIGYVSPSGKMMIQPQFEHAWPFSDGLAFVWTYAGRNSGQDKMPLGEEYKQYSMFSNDITGIIDSTGTYIVQPKMNFQMVRPFQDGIAYVRIDNEVRIINKKGELIPFTDYRYDKQYKQILRVAKNKETGKASFVNAYSRIVYQGFDGCEEFSGNYAAVKLGGKTGYINRSGDLVIVPQFSEGGPFINGYATVVIISRDEENRDIKYYGLIDTLGNYVLAPKYLWMGDNSEGIVVFNDVENGGIKSGYIDLNGNVIVPPTYSRAYPFSEGLACVQLNGKYGYINKKGEMVIEPVFNWGRPFKSGVANVTNKDGEQCLINTSGIVIYGPIKKGGNCD